MKGAFLNKRAESRLKPTKAIAIEVWNMLVPIYLV
jgi:hypothetical protein